MFYFYYVHYKHTFIHHTSRLCECDAHASHPGGPGDWLSCGPSWIFSVIPVMTVSFHVLVDSLVLTHSTAGLLMSWDADSVVKRTINK